MKKYTEKEIKFSKKDIDAIVSNDSISKSEKIRSLFNLGIEIKEIAGYLSIRYNFVYNVVSNYININDIKIVSEDKVSKKDLIVELFNQGKSNKEISIELKTNYNYVFNTLKVYKSTLKESNEK